MSRPPRGKLLDELLARGGDPRFAAGQFLRAAVGKFIPKGPPDNEMVILNRLNLAAKRSAAWLASPKPTFVARRRRDVVSATDLLLDVLREMGADSGDRAEKAEHLRQLKAEFELGLVDEDERDALFLDRVASVGARYFAMQLLEVSIAQTPAFLVGSSEMRALGILHRVAASSGEEYWKKVRQEATPIVRARLREHIQALSEPWDVYAQRARTEGLSAGSLRSLLSRRSRKHREQLLADLKRRLRTLPRQFGTRALRAVPVSSP